MTTERSKQPCQNGMPTQQLIAILAKYRWPIAKSDGWEIIQSRYFSCTPSQTRTSCADEIRSLMRRPLANYKHFSSPKIDIKQCVELEIYEIQFDITKSATIRLPLAMFKGSAATGTRQQCQCTDILVLKHTLSEFANQYLHIQETTNLIYKEL